MLTANSFQNMSIAKRLSFLVAAAVSGLLILTAIFLISEKTLISEERQDSVKHTVEVAHSLVAYYHGQVGQAKMSDAEARQAAIAAVKALRYGEGDYVWINDLGPKMIMHPMKPALDGQDLSGNKDPNGKFLFNEMVDVVKSKGAGFVFYMWAKPGKDQPVQKVSYVKGFTPLGVGLRLRRLY